MLIHHQHLVVETDMFAIVVEHGARRVGKDHAEDVAVFLSATGDTEKAVSVTMLVTLAAVALRHVGTIRSRDMHPPATARAPSR